MPLVILGAVLLLLMLLQSYGYRKLWDRGLAYRAGFSSKEVFEGDRLFLREELVNNKFLPLPWVFIKFQLPSQFIFVNANAEPLPHNIAGSLYAIMSYTTIRRRRPFVCQKRGVYNLRSANVAVSDLLHNQEYNKDFILHGELLVFPKPLEKCEKIDLLFKQLDAAVLSNRLINPDPFEFRGLREYQPTDPLRNVNFKATAVAQEMMVNIHAPTAAQRLVLALNLEDMDAPAELHEQGIRLCATLGEHYINRDAHMGFHTNGRCWTQQQTIRIDKTTHLPIGSGASQLYRLLECLARITPRVQCPPMAEYINQLTDTQQVYVFISSYDGADFREAFNALEERGIEAFWIVPFIE
ncbi:MAG: DUF58 domain-containing protein [Defluviitaleaceae bacterium]|nr:DUF58 domain-containing protein [Defluviitaleaceae bacterium]MCL2240575.1 DUF58 domain-containing protein [Defluviitaleaceae bacterium]